MTTVLSFASQTFAFLPPEPGLTDVAWFCAAMLIGLMGIYLAAINRTGEDKCPDIIPLFYVSIAALLLIDINKTRWFQEGLIDVVVELLLIALIVVGAASFFKDQIDRYDLRPPREAAGDAADFVRQLVADDSNRDEDTGEADTDSEQN